MNCNLVQILGSDKKVDFEAISGLTGISVITLRHKDAFTEKPVCMRGFQGGKIKINNRNGDVSYSFYPYKNKNNEDTFTPRNLYFSKNELTRENMAVIPDTKYNRKKLASIFYSTNAPTIMTKEVYSEIKEMADRLDRKANLTKKKDAQLLEASKELELVQKKNELLEKELKKIKEKGEVFKTLTTTADNEALIKFVKKRIEKEVFTEKANLINNLKKDGEGWKESESYKKDVLDLIDKRCIEALAEEGISDVEYKAIT